MTCQELSEQETQRVKELISAFEWATVNETAVRRISGGFAIAELDSVENNRLYFTLKWGVQNEGESNVHTEHFYLEREVLSTPQWDPNKAQQHLMETN